MNLERIGVLLKKVQFVRLAIALILLNGVVFALLLVPNRSKIAALQSEYARLRSEVMRGEQNLRQLKTRLGKLQQSRKDLEYIYAKVLVPKRNGVTDIRLELESLLESLQIRRQDFNYSHQPLPEFKLRQFKLGVPVEGNYRNIRRFINSVERSKHFLILDRVDLSSEQKSDQLNLDFSLSTYLVEDET